MVRILFFGDLVEAFGTPAEDMALPAEVTDIERLLFVLSRRGEIWKKMLLGNPQLKITVNRQFADKTTPVADGDEVALVGFSMA